MKWAVVRGELIFQINKHLKKLDAIKIAYIKQWVLKNKAKLGTGADSETRMKGKGSKRSSRNVGFFHRID